MTKTTKLDRLEMLFATLSECMGESVKDAEEWNTYDSMKQRVKDLILEEQRRLGYMVVYEIVDGSAQDELFTGTKDACKTYTDILIENDPKMKGNIIVIPL